MMFFNLLQSPGGVIGLGFHNKRFKYLIRLSGFLLISIGLSSCLMTRSRPTRISAVQPTPELLPQYQVHSLPHSTVYTLKIPAQGKYQVTVVSSAQLMTVSDFAKKYSAIAAMNAGFFDAQNQKTTAYITEQGKLTGDPKQNERLIENPKLTPYLPQIFNRSELRRYQCGNLTRYAITVHNAPIPRDCQLMDAIGGGPRLLPDMTATEEGFWQVTQGKVVRDAIGFKQRNARTAIGITASGDLLWVMAAQRPDAPKNSGLSLPELADFMRSQGVEEALNLDGGSSSGMYYDGKMVFGKVTEKGEPVVRSVKSVLLLR
ncbi:MAG: phosphodiester glycosidase family protein [Snowella sp.]|nr:phosphodiester glycosidase family protein [Snowella sp.]